MINKTIQTLFNALLIFSCLFLLEPSTIYAKAKKIIRVPQDHAIIQEAIKLAAPDGTVLLSPGVYHQTNIGVYSGVTLMGEDAETTIIDGDNKTYYALNVNNKYDVIIQDLTVRDSFGIRLENSENVVVKNIISRNNQYYGIHIKENLKNGLIENNRIFYNSKGIQTTYDNNSVTIARNYIYKNTNFGINLLGRSTDIHVFNNTIDNNHTGIAIQQRNAPEIINNSITNNWGIGVSKTSVVPIIFQNNNTWGNEYDYYGFTPDATNISVDPLYLDPSTYNYAIDCTSPLVDVGIKVKPIYLKHYTPHPDIGAFETETCKKIKLNK